MSMPPVGFRSSGQRRRELYLQKMLVRLINKQQPGLMCSYSVRKFLGNIA